MKKIKSNIRVAELDSFSDGVIRLYKADKNVAKDAYLKNVMAEIEDLSDRITSAIKSDRIISTLKSMDDSRNEIIRSLGLLLNGYSVLHDENKKNAAVSLLSIHNKYKGIVQDNYSAKSSLIESMLGDFNNPSLQETILLLDEVALFISDLRAAQDKFNQSSDEYTKAIVLKGESASAVRKLLIAIINDKFIPYLNAMSLSNEAVFGDFISNLETMIEKTNQSVTRRSKSDEIDIKDEDIEAEKDEVTK